MKMIPISLLGPDALAAYESIDDESRHHTSGKVEIDTTTGEVFVVVRAGSPPERGFNPLDLILPYPTPPAEGTILSSTSIGTLGRPLAQISENPERWDFAPIKPE